MRRGFALPLVILLALVVGIMAAVMLDRQSAQSLTVQRELNQYRDHHFSSGVREVVGQWTDQLSGQPIDKLVQDDGHILDIQLADGGFMSVYMFDGQGSALTDPTGLIDQDRTDAQGILEALAPLVGDSPPASLFRTVGPVKISAMTAAPEVLEAVANYAAGSGRVGRRFSESIVKARTQNNAVVQSDIQTAESAADLTAEQRQIAERLLALKPDLWNMVIDVYPQGSTAPTIRYGGRWSPGNGRTTLNTLGKFLSWEELPLDEPIGQ
jgi:hypothetical protein